MHTYSPTYADIRGIVEGTVSSILESRNSIVMGQPEYYEQLLRVKTNTCKKWCKYVPLMLKLGADLLDSIGTPEQNKVYDEFLGILVEINLKNPKKCDLGLLCLGIYDHLTR